MKKSYKILYVEDEPFLAKIVKESLESRDFSVRLITDGGNVLDQLANWEADVCLLDIMLPTLDGFTIARLTKKQFPHLPIIFLTAKSQTEDVLEGFKTGARDYIKKPFSMEELIVRIYNILNFTHPDQSLQKNGIISIGQYQFDPLKMQLIFQEKVKRLSYREVEILKLLCAHQNEKIERSQLLKSIWGDDSFFNSRNLDVYIKKLRNYLKDDAGIEIITLKGVGYHFSVK
ncbi:MAG: response regulator transcription factor [Saprospiraceae bacterium]